MIQDPPRGENYRNGVVELDGRLLNNLPLTPLDGGQKSFTVPMPRFAVRSVRLLRI